MLFPSTATVEGTLAARVLAAAAAEDGAPDDGVTLRFTLAHREPLEVRAQVSVGACVMWQGCRLRVMGVSSNMLDELRQAASRKMSPQS